MVYSLINDLVQLVLSIQPKIALFLFNAVSLDYPTKKSKALQHIKTTLICTLCFNTLLGQQPKHVSLRLHFIVGIMLSCTERSFELEGIIKRLLAK